jgi:alcohol dehydrogenase
VVAVTTTAGTGTEADPWTVITHEERQEKIGFGISPLTFPMLSIVDPELMLTVPPQLTAFQGFDAFFHAAEGILANIATPLSDALAVKAIELIAKSLPTAVADGANLEARTEVALANTLAGMVESTSCCTSEHSLAHALSAYHPDLPHGAALIALSVPYFRFFAEKTPDRVAMVAEAMGTAAPHAKSVKGTHPAIVEALESLQNACGVGSLRLSDYGVRQDQIGKYAQNAFDTMGFLFTLDRHALSIDDATRILEEAYR